MNDERAIPAARGRPVAGMAELLDFALAWLWRERWLALIAVIAVTAIVFAVSGVPSTKLWTAAGTIRIGTVPRFVGIDDMGDGLTEAVEDVHATLNRLSDPHFRDAVRNVVESGLGSSSGTELVSSLHGTVVSDRDMRIEVSGTSSTAAALGLQAAISRIQQTHSEMTTARLRLIDAMVRDAQARIMAVQSVSASSSRWVGRESARSSPAAVVIAPSQGDLALLVNLTIARKAAEPTRMVYGMQISLSGPRAGWQLKTVLLVGLGALLAAVMLTLAATVRH